MQGRREKERRRERGRRERSKGEENQAPPTLLSLCYF
jgi:hypothetical protein